MTSLERRGGILLHLTALPGAYGIGSIGEPARAWVRWLSRTGCRVWQFLPIGPTGYGDSPYQSLSAFAGNPLLIDLDDLVERGLLDQSDLEPIGSGEDAQVDYEAIAELHRRALDRAARAFEAGRAPELQPGFEGFQQRQAAWLHDYALFMAIKESQGGAAWTEWPDELALREPPALERAAAELEDRARAHRFFQFLFDLQFQELRAEATEHGITLLGDLPIFVAHDSADVWANQALFKLKEDGHPAAVAGVPPDYFSEDGQLWGVPVYRWDRMTADGFNWWRRRVDRAFSRADWIRLDHFRGFQAHWEVAAGAPNARAGRWVEGPGRALFDAIRGDRGSLPFIAEDLGVITDEVEALRRQVGLPGMKVLQFAFGGGPDNPYLPHNIVRDCVVYTGTHDNNTTRGWFEAAPDSERAFCRRYLGIDGLDIAWDLIRTAWASVSGWAIAPMQDFLDLGAEARMNTPGSATGNWRWRLKGSELTEALADRIGEINHLYGRS